MPGQRGNGESRRSGGMPVNPRVHVVVPPPRVLADAVRRQSQSHSRHTPWTLHTVGSPATWLAIRRNTSQGFLSRAGATEHPVLCLRYGQPADRQCAHNERRLRAQLPQHVSHAPKLRRPPSADREACQGCTAGGRCAPRPLPGIEHSGEKVEGLYVLGPDDGEMAPVQRGHVGQVQPFGDGDD